MLYAIEMAKQFSEQCRMVESFALFTIESANMAARAHQASVEAARLISFEAASGALQILSLAETAAKRLAPPPIDFSQLIGCQLAIANCVTAGIPNIDRFSHSYSCKGLEILAEENDTIEEEDQPKRRIGFRFDPNAD